MIKIIPKVGKPYYLVDDRGDGKFSRQESLDSGVRPPRGSYTASSRWRFSPTFPKRI